MATIHTIPKLFSLLEPHGLQIYRADLSYYVVLGLAGIIALTVLGALFRLLAGIGRKPIRFLSRNLRLKLAISYFLTAFIPIFLLTLGALIAFYIFTGGYRSGLGKQALFNEASRLGELAENMAETAGIRNRPGGSPGEPLEMVSRGLFSIESVEYLLVEEPEKGNIIRRVLRISPGLGCVIPVTEYVPPFWVPLRGAQGIFISDDGVYLRAIGVAEEETGRIYADLYRRIDRSFLQGIKNLMGTDITLRIEPVVGNGLLDDTPPWERVITTRSGDGSGGFWSRELRMGIAPIELFDWKSGDIAMERAFVEIHAAPGELMKSSFSTSNRVNFILLVVLRVLVVLIMLMVVFALGAGFVIARRITGSVAVLRRGTRRIRDGDLEWEIPRHTDDELGELADSFNEMRREIKRMLAELGEKERMEKELQIARSIQRNLFPKELPAPEGVQIWADSFPAREVGGDYYDCLRGPGRKLRLVIADVSGKGVSAALLMSNLQASLHALLSVSSASMEEIMGELNALIYENSTAETFITLFYGELDLENGTLEFVNAGHNFPVRLRGGEVVELSEGGMILGAFPDAHFEIGRIGLQGGDLLFMYTDGVIEARDPEGNEFGEERLRNFLLERADRNPDEIGNGLYDIIRRFNGKDVQDDDVTLLVLKVGVRAFQALSDVSVTGGSGGE